MIRKVRKGAPIFVQRVPVESSNLVSVGYNVRLQQLEVEFKTGVVYGYSAVPRRLYEGLLLAESAGRFMGRYIKGKFEYHVIG